MGKNLKPPMDADGRRWSPIFLLALFREQLNLGSGLLNFPLLCFKRALGPQSLSRLRERVAEGRERESGSALNKVQAFASTSSYFCLKMIANAGVSTKETYRRPSASIGGSTKRFLLPALISIFLQLAPPTHAQVQIAEPPIDSPALAQRLKKLESELRCLVCQNQTLAESPAGLANDLRREVRALIAQGKTDDEVKAFLQARYGDFVLYRPPVTSKTYLLWYGPFGLLLGGGLVVWLVARRRASLVMSPVDAASANDLSRARKLLDDADKEDKHDR